MSNYKCYGAHRSRKGAEPQPHNSSCVLDIKPPRDDLYGRMVEIADVLIKRKGYDEDYAMEKAAEMLEKNDELFYSDDSVNNPQGGRSVKL